ncbi:Uncharacterised protein [Mycobacteroides abscessus subsp. abscessus]|nr:Uncharacterised protein [Mycobacteroides abscessus subsp. abscessus]
MAKARCNATARPESVHAMSVAAGCSSTTSLARLGPLRTATRLGSAPVTWTMTWLMRNRLSSSMPLATLTSVVSSPRYPVQADRLVRSVWDGTASSTVQAPVSASAGSAVALMDAGSARSPRYFEFRWVSLISRATSALRAHNVTLLPASARTFASAVPHAPAPITAASTTRQQ